LLRLLEHAYWAEEVVEPDFTGKAIFFKRLSPDPKFYIIVPYRIGYIGPIAAASICALNTTMIDCC
jgi:hypothetical protein